MPSGNPVFGVPPGVASVAASPGGGGLGGLMLAEGLDPQSGASTREPAG